jgi:hypothetical protein
LICSSEELAGISLKRIELGVDVSPLHDGIISRNIKYEIKTDFS